MSDRRYHHHHQRQRHQRRVLGRYEAERQVRKLCVPFKCEDEDDGDGNCKNSSVYVSESESGGGCGDGGGDGGGIRVGVSDDHPGGDNAGNNAERILALAKILPSLPFWSWLMRGNSHSHLSSKLHVDPSAARTRSYSFGEAEEGDALAGVLTATCMSCASSMRLVRLQKDSILFSAQSCRKGKGGNAVSQTDEALKRSLRLNHEKTKDTGGSEEDNDDDDDDDDDDDGCFSKVFADIDYASVLRDAVSMPSSPRVLSQKVEVSKQKKVAKQRKQQSTNVRFDGKENKNDKPEQRKNHGNIRRPSDPLAATIIQRVWRRKSAVIQTIHIAQTFERLEQMLEHSDAPVFVILTGAVRLIVSSTDRTTAGIASDDQEKEVERVEELAFGAGDAISFDMLQSIDCSGIRSASTSPFQHRRFTSIRAVARSAVEILTIPGRAFEQYLAYRHQLRSAQQRSWNSEGEHENSEVQHKQSKWAGVMWAPTFFAASLSDPPKKRTPLQLGAMATLVRGLDFFALVPNAQLRAIVQVAQLQKYTRSTAIAYSDRQCEQLYVVIDGEVSVGQPFYDDAYLQTSSSYNLHGRSAAAQAETQSLPGQGTPEDVLYHILYAEQTDTAGNHACRLEHTSNIVDVNKFCHRVGITHQRGAAFGVWTNAGKEHDTISIRHTTIHTLYSRAIRLCIHKYTIPITVLIRMQTCCTV